MRPILLATLACCLGGAMARAATIDTFTFTDGGFSGAFSPGSTGVLSGTFTGVVGSNGYIGLADLSAITVSYTTGPASDFGYGPATFFSFNPASASTLNFETGIGIGGTACVGAVAAFGFGQCGAGGVNGFVLGDTTQALPTVTLISSVFQPPPQPLPIPGPVPVPQPQPTPMPPMFTPMPEPSGAGTLLAAGLLLVGVRGAMPRHGAARGARPRRSA